MPTLRPRPLARILPKLPPHYPPLARPPPFLRSYRSHPTIHLPLANASNTSPQPREITLHPSASPSASSYNSSDASSSDSDSSSSGGGGGGDDGPPSNLPSPPQPNGGPSGSEGGFWARRDYHPFDTHRFVRRLQGAGLPEGAAEGVMRATRALITQHAHLARSTLLSKADLENAAYLFKAALSELRTELSVRGRSDAATLRSVTAVVAREVDNLGQKMKEDMAMLKNDIQLDMNNRKEETQTESKAFEMNVQTLNNRITIILGDVRTEIERRKWDITIRVFAIILFEGVLFTGLILFTAPDAPAPPKAAHVPAVETRLPTAEELGIRPTEEDERII